MREKDGKQKLQQPLPVLVVELGSEALSVSGAVVAALLLRVLHVRRVRGLHASRVALARSGHHSLRELIRLSELRFVRRVHTRVEEREHVLRVQDSCRVSLFYSSLERFDAAAVGAPCPCLGGERPSAVREGSRGNSSCRNSGGTSSKDGADCSRSGHGLTGGHFQGAVKRQAATGGVAQLRLCFERVIAFVGLVCTIHNSPHEEVDRSKTYGNTRRDDGHGQKTRRPFIAEEV